MEDGRLYVDIPRLLKNCGLRDTEDNRDQAVRVVKELAEKEWPGIRTIEVRGPYSGPGGVKCA